MQLSHHSLTLVMPMAACMLGFSASAGEPQRKSMPNDMEKAGTGALAQAQDWKPCEGQVAVPESRSAVPNHGQIQNAPYKKVREGFAQPDMICAPFTFWFWDEPLDAGKYPAKARDMAREMLKQGINPGYAHPRVSMADLLGPKGMAPSPSLPKDQWLSPEWFTAFDGALEEAEAAKGYFSSCDDYMWPMGRAAGRVIKQHPELANASLQWEVKDVAGGTNVELPESFFTVAAQLDRKPEPPEPPALWRRATIRSATLRQIGSGAGFKWTAPAEGHWRIYTFRKVVGGDVNCLDNRLAEAYIAIAHKPYMDRYGDRNGKAIPGVFCDTEGNYGNGGGLAWSDCLAPRYFTNTTRDIRLWMPLMLDQDVEGISARARFDWFEAVSDLYAGFYESMSAWLAQRGMYYTGHVWEESLTWQTSCVGDHMKVQRGFSMPGCDALTLNGYQVHDSKEAQSVAEFEGRRTMNEILGAGGWPTFNPVTMKEIVNSVVAWGISHVIHHGVFMSRGLDGNVWVPDWYNENPLWSNIHLWSDFTRRASYVNSQGRVVPDVLLLNPMESVWALLGQTEKLWWSSEAGHVGHIPGLYDPTVQVINDSYSEAMKQLTSHRVEYLVGDRHYVNQMSLEGAQLVRGEFRFKTVVVPPLVVVPLNVASKIVDFAKAGGLVYTLGELPTGSTDNGLHDPAMADLMSQLRAQPTVKACTQGLAHELDAKAPGLKSPIEFVSGDFPMLQLRRRIDNRDFFWLANNSTEARQCVVRVAEVTGGASVWDCETGTIRPVASAKDGSGSRLQLAFQPHEAYWLVFDSEQQVQSKPIMALPAEKEVLAITGPWNVRVDTTVQPKLEHEVKLPEALTGAAGVAHEVTLWETWTELPTNFSGLVDYTKTITLPKTEGELILDLGTVNHFAEVWVNGKHVGAKLWPPHKFQTDAFRAGTNEIRIRVGNLVNNNYNMASPSGLVGPVIVKTSTP